MFTLQSWTYSSVVLLSSIKALTLYKDRYAVRNRSTQLQLQCQGDSTKCKYSPDIVVESDEVKDKWKCEAKLPDGIDLDMINIACEGYNDPDDSQVLSESYVLRFTLKGNEIKSKTIYNSYNYINRIPEILFISFLYIIIALFGFVIMSQNTPTTVIRHQRYIYSSKIPKIQYGNTVSNGHISVGYGTSNSE